MASTHRQRQSQQQVRHRHAHRHSGDQIRRIVARLGRKHRHPRQPLRRRPVSRDRAPRTPAAGSATTRAPPPHAPPPTRPHPAAPPPSPPSPPAARAPTPAPPAPTRSPSDTATVPPGTARTAPTPAPIPTRTPPPAPPHSPAFPTSAADHGLNSFMPSYASTLYQLTRPNPAIAQSPGFYPLYRPETREHAMRQLLGRANSSNVMKVIWLLEEMGLPVRAPRRRRQVRRHRHPRTTARSTPTASSPPSSKTISCSGRATPSSATSPPPTPAPTPGEHLLAARPPRPRQRVDRWMDWLQTTLGPQMTPVFWGLVRTRPGERDQAAIAKAAARLRRALRASWTACSADSRPYRRPRPDPVRHRHRRPRHRWFNFEGVDRPDSAASPRLVRPPARPPRLPRPRRPTPAH